MKGKFPTLFAKETNHVSIICFCLNLQVLLVILNIFLHLMLLFCFASQKQAVMFHINGAVWVLVT